MQKSHLTAFPPLYVFSILNQIFKKIFFEVLYFRYRNEQVTLPFSFGSVQGLFLNVKGPFGFCPAKCCWKFVSQHCILFCGMNWRRKALEGSYQHAVCYANSYCLYYLAV